MTTPQQLQLEDRTFHTHLRMLFLQCRRAMRKRGIRALTGEEKLLKRQAIDVADRLLSQLEGKHMIRAWHLDKEIKASGDGGSA